MRRIGIGYRRAIAPWIDSRPPEIGCLEVTAEHFFDSPQALHKLRAHYPIFVHGLGLSLGTPGPLNRRYLERFKAVCDAADARWASEHIAFTRAADIDLGHLNPICPGPDAFAVLSDHITEVMETLSRPLLLENITSHVRVQGRWSETEFMNRLCEQTGCGILLDVTNLYINSRNHDFDAHAWLRELTPSAIRQLHVVGYSHRDGRFEDLHAEATQDEVLELMHAAVAYADVQAIVLERDERFPHPAELAAELKRMEATLV